MKILNWVSQPHITKRTLSMKRLILASSLLTVLLSAYSISVSNPDMKRVLNVLRQGFGPMAPQNN